MLRQIDCFFISKCLRVDIMHTGRQQHGLPAIHGITYKALVDSNDSQIPVQDFGIGVGRVLIMHANEHILHPMEAFSVKAIGTISIIRSANISIGDFEHRAAHWHAHQLGATVHGGELFAFMTGIWVNDVTRYLFSSMLFSTSMWYAGELSCCFINSSSSCGDAIKC